MPRSARSEESLPGLLAAHAARVPGREVFTWRNAAGECLQRLSYGDLHKQSGRLAASLQEAGLAAGDRVLLVHPPGLDLIVALFAAMRIGVLATIPPVTSLAGVAAPATRKRILSIAADCEARLAIGLEAQQAAVRESGLHFLASDAALSGQGHGGAAPATPGEVAFLQYTSGSTSNPRGVMVTHANIIANARALIDHPPVGATWLPMFHDMGLVGNFLFPVVLGGECHAMSAHDFLRRPLSWLRLASLQKATYAASPPFGIRRVLEALDRDPASAAGIDLSSLKTVMVGAEQVPPDLIAEARSKLACLGLRDDVLVAGYGLAEATLAVTRGGARAVSFDPEALRRGQASPASSGAHKAMMSCGRPVPRTEVIIRDRESGAELGPGAVGEIRVRGAGVTPGYWHERGGPVRRELETGDLGFLLDGELYVCGRADEVIIQRGTNYHPEDIEAVIGRSGVAAFVDDAGRSTLLVETNEPEALCELRDRVRRETGLELDRVVLAVPRSIRRTTSGKLARKRTAEALRLGRIRIKSERIWSSDEERDVIATLTAMAGQSPELAARPVSETGITSLQLVELQLSLEELASRAGLSPASIDGPSIQASTLGEILEFAALADAGAPAARLLEVIASSGRRRRADERAQMQEDANLALPDFTPRQTCEAEANLLTGATGFLGGFLLASLLRQSALPVIVLARASAGKTARERVLRSLRLATNVAPGLERRIEVIEADIERPLLGLHAADWARLGSMRLAIYHNAAMVDYVRPYATLRSANVLGTHTLLRLALEGAATRFHHVSTTFVFGWTRKPVLFEGDANHARNGLDFGYSQSKWVAERLVMRARAKGLASTIYRPSLVSVPPSLAGDANDVAARLLAFMIRHKVAVDTPNQLSLVPVDVTANNLVSLSLQPEAAGSTYHLTADRYYSLTDVTRQIGADFGIPFREYPIPEFLDFLNRNVRSEDPVYPLLDFFNRCAPHIAAMTLKRYDNRAYRVARDRSVWGMPDPDLASTSSRLVRFLDSNGWSDVGLTELNGA